MTSYKRRATDRFSISRACKLLILVAGALGVIWAAATPYIDMRMDKKLNPVHDALVYQSCLIMSVMDSTQISRAEWLYKNASKVNFK